MQGEAGSGGSSLEVLTVSSHTAVAFVCVASGMLLVMFFFLSKAFFYVLVRPLPRRSGVSLGPRAKIHGLQVCAQARVKAAAAVAGLCVLVLDAVTRWRCCVWRQWGVVSQPYPLSGSLRSRSREP